jgi:hypothetical protein
MGTGALAGIIFHWFRTPRVLFKARVRFLAISGLAIKSPQNASKENKVGTWGQRDCPFVSDDKGRFETTEKRCNNM